MEIIVDDIYSSVLHPKDHVSALAVIREACKARPEGYQYSKKFRQHRWDGYISLMGGFAKFPTGLLSVVLEKLDERGYKYNLKRNGNHTTEMTDVKLEGIELRDYQLDAINKLIQAGRGTAQMATNSGKTEVMAGIIKSLGFPQTVVLLHRKELMYQTQERFEKRLGCNIGIIGDGVWEPGNITITMIQTLANKIDGFMLDGNMLVMVDECHHISSQQMLDVLCQIPGRYRFGFSGTPLKYDVLSDMKLMGATGPVVVEVANKLLMDEGYSAIPKIQITRIKWAYKSDEDLKYADAYKKLLVDNFIRNNAIRAQALDANGNVLILVNQIAHGKRLEHMIPGSIFVNGSDTTEYRKMVLDTMRDDKGIFIASPIFDEGIDVPAINHLILAAGGKSHIKVLQRLGRGMRRKDGDNRLYVYDFLDVGNKYLRRHSRVRIDIYEHEGFEVLYD